MKFTFRAPVGPVAGKLAEALAAALPDAFEAFGAAGDETALDARSRYIGYLLGAQVPGHGALKSPSSTAKTTYHRRAAGMLIWAVGNTADAARWIEEGQDERDMKLCLPTAKKARRTKPTKKDPTGHLYLVIPFRHGTGAGGPVNEDGKTGGGLNAMPPEVYAMAKAMSRSKVVGQAVRLSATGHWVPAWRYEWGDRLHKQAIMAAGVPEQQAGRYDGMYRFGEKGHSTYLTFRVMSQASPSGSWIRKAIKPLPALATALSQAREAHEEALGAAFVADVEVLAAQLLGG